jgi:tRNA-dihydrouridine synthase 2
VEAATLVAGHVAGVDLNCGCPKPFSIKGGMGAALLQNSSLLEDILRALVMEIGKVYNIAISCKIRLLDTQQATEELVERLCQTGISALSVHCRTTPMRNKDKAMQERIKSLSDICHTHGVFCFLNGDVDGYEAAQNLITQYGVDGAMIARAAQYNPSCFSATGPLESQEVARQVLQSAIDTEHHFSNTKYILTALLGNSHGKKQIFRELVEADSWEALCRPLGIDEALCQDLPPVKSAKRRREEDREQGRERNLVGQGPIVINSGLLVPRSAKIRVAAHK